MPVAVALPRRFSRRGEMSERGKIFGKELARSSPRRIFVYMKVVINFFFANDINLSRCATGI